MCQKLGLAVVAVVGSCLFGPACAQETSTPEGFVDVEDVIPSIVLDMRYVGQHNFIGRPIAGYSSPKAYLTSEAADAVARVQDELLSLGLSLKIYDAYRPQHAVNDFIEWARDLDDTVAREEFYPEVDKESLFREGYISERSSHTRGSTLDLTIVPYPPPPQPEWLADNQTSCKLPADERYRDNSLDMGTGYDCFDALSWTASEQINPDQRAHRLLLKSLMEKHGFRNYAKEWWHYTLVEEPFPDTYFDFPVQ